jgi:hypothetical protein
MLVPASYSEFAHQSHYCQALCTQSAGDDPFLLGSISPSMCTSPHPPMPLDNDPAPDLLSLCSPWTLACHHVAASGRIIPACDHWQCLQFQRLTINIAHVHLQETMQAALTARINMPKDMPIAPPLDRYRRKVSRIRVTTHDHSDSALRVNCRHISQQVEAHGTENTPTATAM